MKTRPNITHTTLTFVASIALAGNAMAAAVDLSGWTSTDGNGNWIVQPGNDSVIQTINGDPTFFFEPGTNAQGLALSGNITVEGTDDDDYIGFGLGLDDGENSASSTNFILIDWKQGDQTSSGRFASKGLAASHVTDASAPLDFWDHSGGVTEIQRATTLGDTGWADNTTYDFELIFNPNLIQVSVDGMLELSITPADAGLGTFDNGAFAFYNYSQDPVRYGAIEEDTAPPDPGPKVPDSGTGALLMALALVQLAFLKRRLSRSNR